MSQIFIKCDVFHIKRQKKDILDTENETQSKVPWLQDATVLFVPRNKHLVSVDIVLYLSCGRI